MSEEQTTALSLKAAYEFGAEHRLAKEMHEIKGMIIKWHLKYGSSLRRGYVVELFERHNIFDAFKSGHWAYGNTSSGETKRRWYLRVKKQYADFLSGVDQTEADEPLSELEFAAEAHLRDFLA
jgi:hypothetical protein